MTILEIQHVNKTFGKRVVLNDISLQIESSSIIALVGANGAGKTTLINIILNLIPKDSGQVTFLTKNNWKQITGVMMQDNIALHRITIKEIINLTRSYFNHPLSYEELLSVSGLEDHQNSLMTGLSGGQKRRLTFALALAGDPKVLFLDEPTVGMDSNSRNAFWQEIDHLKKSGKTIFVTSHYLEELENIADRFLILQNSIIAFDGTIKQLRSREGQSLIEFDSELNQMDFKGLQDIVSLNVVGHHFQIITNDVNQLLAELTPYLKAIDNLQIKQATLDTLLLNYKENTHE
ncbi:ABC transporter ATP-binding protein [Companilactobacillus nuruki]|uniref:ABC transporter ATP-binding protein n=1 Tax=Companilactobacillus nuruki TaxID=1993540 RepID=A0A2N7AU40_9LACO|nr:ABC transporter ATP-binding protein [Companilactobacillus nuruki]PMD70313.1 ABC transporter ATP-binding protein [Companilactobacillus nuruki]